MTLAQMSLTGGVMAATVIVIRTLTRGRLPRQAILPLWYAVLARLLVPFSLPCAWSAYTLLARLRVSPAVPDTHVTVPAPAAAVITPAAPAVNALPTAPEAPWLSINPWIAVWVLGAVCCAAFFAAAYIRCRRRFAESLPAEDERVHRWLEAHRLVRRLSLRQSDRVRAPLTYGVLRPVILLPRDFDWDETESAKYVLEHEYVHVRRLDAAVKLLLTAALCLHWFNPLAWCVYVLANRDIELSCDEAVLRRFGPEAKSAYAMALIRMAGSGDGPAPLYSGFGKSAVEERITAIMKMKKTSFAALLVAACLLAGVTTAFATSAATDIEDRDRAANAQTVTAIDTVMSYTDDHGRIWYSEDGGKSFMSEEEYNALYPETEVEWWTYEEYSAWLENERTLLQEMLGERGWTGGRGEFVWTQEIINETIALYEEILEQIGRGVLVSKTVNGSEDTMLMQGIDDMLLGVGESGVSAADFAEYAPFGLEWDEAQKALFYNGERVRYFLDGAEVDDFGGMAVRLEYADRELEGELDLRAVRQRVDNADGSYDPMGPLLRLEKCPEGMFDERASSSPALAQATADIYFRELSAETNAETEKLLEKYAPFGLSWRSHPVTGELSMSWNGKTVHSLFDSVEQVWIANNMNGTDLEAGALELEGVYEKGKLTGLREVQAQPGAVTAAEQEPPATGGVTAVAEGTGEPGGRTFAEIFEKYAALGITYVEANGASGSGNVYLNGRLVSWFADVKPDGGVFTFDSADEGGLAVQTVYDGTGKLTGVRELG